MNAKEDDIVIHILKQFREVAKMTVTEILSKAGESEEVFGKENDLMDWEFANQALEWWTSRLKELRNAG